MAPEIKLQAGVNLERRVEMACKWGEKMHSQRNSTAWMCMHKTPLSLVARVGRVDYREMEINTCLCTKEGCRCYQEETT